MILWMDFVLDDVVGPILSEQNVEDLKVCRRTRLGSPSIRTDASSSSLIQETSQGFMPAQSLRQDVVSKEQSKAGLNILDSNAATDMEVGRSDRAGKSLRQEGGRT